MRALADSLGRRAEGDLRLRVMAATLGPAGVAHLEDPDVVDRVRDAQSVGTGEITVKDATTGIAASTAQHVAAVLSAVVLAAYRWWLAAALLVICVGTTKVRLARADERRLPGLRPVRTDGRPDDRRRRPPLRRRCRRRQGRARPRGVDRRPGRPAGRTGHPARLELRRRSRAVGGPVQKLALARAMLRPAPLLLVLDEPTAALDAETEHQLFVRYASAASKLAAGTGAITLIVSHRFSTVRMAAGPHR